MTKPVLSLSAPAKLNLFLHIVGRRADGYHELETLFQFIDLTDELRFSLRDDQQLTLQCSDAELNQADNLVLRAAHLLRDYALHHPLPRVQKHLRGIHIDLQKNIPHGGGLGGGSSDAATTLLALKQLWQIPISSQELLDLGARLGADVPIFLHGHAAFAQGIGEKLTPAAPEELWYLVIHPAVAVSTQSIFQHPDLPRATTPLNWPHWTWRNTQNNCEALVRRLYPEVAKALDWLLQYAPARLTGTGSCLFGRFTSHEKALRILQKLPNNWRGYVVKGLNESPVCAQLRQASLSNRTIQS
ncbi:4-(cytidine 5'-diphospho)-2-C-methyl-D-erythritol kinase [Pseudidiomarina taiwanensis]|uniref:4-diphosphocytidyl-2-C-methyl-D-erythritol kinase n=1 Tax=Pseudidiomarina taiwanensis TaxID=337250 RepID=A0A432ZP36_9GAMM|nr:4-(cytidine 5'-diphospho)-2-C-methyl-D-erythritol kinase [Pseudidiomarina taiwanensis]RUO79621.1 4-(cytidine 5'-diphospho)-2-C-methyl-D-erythritol kinase [Pseudidiomarina taiwanensis]